MNKTNFDALVKHLKKVPAKHFDIETTRNYYPDKDDPCSCIAGHAWYLMDEKDKDDWGWESKGVNKWLGISFDEGMQLFFPDHMNEHKISKAKAIRTLTNFVDTGKINFSI